MTQAQTFVDQVHGKPFSGPIHPGQVAAEIAGIEDAHDIIEDMEEFHVYAFPDGSKAGVRTNDHVEPDEDDEVPTRCWDAWVIASK